MKIPLTKYVRNQMWRRKPKPVEFYDVGQVIEKPDEPYIFIKGYKLRVKCEKCRFVEECPNHDKFMLGLICIGEK